MGIASHLFGTARVGPAQPRSELPRRQPSARPAERAFTYLAATEPSGRSALTSGPSRMALGRRTPLGECVHY